MSRKLLAKKTPSKAASSADSRLERKRTEQAQAWLAAIVNSSVDAIVGKDLDGIIMSWNRSAEVIFGYRAEEIVGKHVTTLIPPERYDEEVIGVS